MISLTGPRRFLRSNTDTGVIIDEAQRVPELFSYLQRIVNDSGQMGRYILTGSRNFLLLEKITQSLAGRVAILHLMPFGVSELEAEDVLPQKLDEILFKGPYPSDRGYRFSKRVSLSSCYVRTTEIGTSVSSHSRSSISTTPGCFARFSACAKRLISVLS